MNPTSVGVVHQQGAAMLVRLGRSTTTRLSSDNIPMSDSKAAHSDEFTIGVPFNSQPFARKDPR